MGGLYTDAGGVPIVRGGLLAGAIGVSGATADQDGNARSPRSPP